MSRRSFSVTGLTYQRLRDFSDECTEELSVSGVLEKWITEAMDDAGQPVPSMVLPPSKKKRRSKSPEGLDHALITF